uniref:Uncharacterized protein n=1 Tax=Romanomermis culicivorax TaxID=13658 RepID=A0A915J9V1_ROMCU
MREKRKSNIVHVEAVEIFRRSTNVPMFLHSVKWDLDFLKYPSSLPPDRIIQMKRSSQLPNTENI